MKREISVEKSYLAARVRKALAEDPRLNELDIQVTVTAGKVFLLGEVASEKRRETAEQISREVLPESVGLVNNLTIASYRETSEEEHLR